MRVDQRLRRSGSSEVLVVLAVASTVLMVLTCLSIKPLDFGYKGDAVICPAIGCQGCLGVP